MSKKFDVIVIGAGLSGLSIALALGLQGLSVALIDKVSAPTGDGDTDDKALALNLSSMHFFESLNIWSSIKANATPIHTVLVTSEKQFGQTQMHAKDINKPCLGYVISSRHLLDSLNALLKSVKTIKVFRPVEVLSYHSEKDHAVIHLKRARFESVLNAPLIVATDGSESKARLSQGIESRHFDYGQSALITNVALDRDPLGIAHERFCTGHTQALLPFGPNRMKSVWIGTHADVKTLQGSSSKDYRQALQNSFRSRHGRLVECGPRYVYPLRGLKSLSQVGERLVLLGNAAHTLHPIAAQGFNLALRDIARLTEILYDEFVNESDLGGVTPLQLFNERAGLDHDKVHIFVHRLNQTTQLGRLPQAFKGLGLLTLDTITPLKRSLIYQAAGLHRDLPKLCRGAALS